MTQETEPSFEEAYRELEATVRRMEAGDLTLEEALAAYEKGVRLARRCQAALDEAQLRVQQLSEGEA
ncbi:MAG TPA: exodeoxyribonuclease VII small subunit [Anaerolineae bacterium]|nr:exodeoxyribonuclease VII small subunit [Anaerolineae bacterium]